MTDPDVLLWNTDCSGYRSEPHFQHWQSTFKKNKTIQVNTSEFSICAQKKKKNVGGRGAEAQPQQQHHTGQQFPNNPLQCPPPFHVVFSLSPFLSLSIPLCPPSITSSSHALLPPDFSLGAAAGPHIKATFMCSCLSHAFILSFTSFFVWVRGMRILMQPINHSLLISSSYSPFSFIPLPRSQLCNLSECYHQRRAIKKHLKAFKKK